MRTPRINPRRGIAAGAVAALSVIGISGALWTDQVSVANKVSTGELDVKVKSARAYEGKAAPWDDPIADCDASITDDAVTITITNAYPGLQCRTWYALKNVGTVPARISNFTQQGMEGINNPGNPAYGVVGTVIQPGDTYSKSIDIRLPASLDEQQLNENATYTYTVTFDFENVTL